MAVLQVMSSLIPSSSQIPLTKTQIHSNSIYQLTINHHQHPRFSSIFSLSKRNSTSLIRNSNFRSCTISCSTHDSATITIESTESVKEKSVSVVLLAGGKGKRMGASMPKQYLPLLGQPIALYSFYTFSRMPQVKEIVVVCDPSYQDIFEDAREKVNIDLRFALPGKERQDSVFSGLQRRT